MPLEILFLFYVSEFSVNYRPVVEYADGDPQGRMLAKASHQIHE